MRPLVLVLPKMSGYLKAFKVKDGNKDRNNRLTSLRREMVRCYKKTIWTKIEDLKNIELNALPVYDDRYVKIKMIT